MTTRPHSPRTTGRALARTCLLLSVVGGLPATVLAAPQDISFRLVAAAPGSYDAQVGGGVYGTGTSEVASSLGIAGAGVGAAVGLRHRNF